MSGLKNTKRRIVSAKNTQKITRAMKLVSSAKFARSHQNISKAKPYGDALDRMLINLAPLMEKHQEELVLMKKRVERKILLIVVTPDRGLCGALNSNILKASHNFLQQKAGEGVVSELFLWGKKAQVFKKRKLSEVLTSTPKVLDKPNYFFCKDEAHKIIADYKNGRWDAVYVAFSKFYNVISQQAKIEPFLPFVSNPDKTAMNLNTLVEPMSVDFVEDILEARLADDLYQVLLQGTTSEHAARMSAMDSATNNADKVIKDLTLEYNRARQAAITKELIEITSGAEAL